MTMKTVKTKGKGSVLSGGLIGGTVSIILTLLLTSVFAWMIVSERLEENLTGYGNVAVILLSSVAGSVTGIKISGAKPMITAAIVYVVYMVTMLLLTAVAFDAKYEGIGVTMTLTAAGSVTPALLMLGKSSTGKRRKAIHR